jgi:hypothetical protein
MAPKRWLIFFVVYGVLPQKTELFIITAARTSNPVSFANILKNCYYCTAILFPILPQYLHYIYGVILFLR